MLAQYHLKKWLKAPPKSSEFVHEINVLTTTQRDSGCICSALRPIGVSRRQKHCQSKKKQYFNN